MNRGDYVSIYGYKHIGIVVDTTEYDTVGVRFRFSPQIYWFGIENVTVVENEG